MSRAQEATPTVTILMATITLSRAAMSPILKRDLCLDPLVSTDLNPRHQHRMIASATVTIRTPFP
ncbi:hypothetical protein ANANG_G00316740 [Anguilla anguilla]|uniref:Uncharacterized protein n=1 Tax=Anguilla anguilla TaxID=7936 RepID=A0A9D3RHP9_ANGAN|nr:hypothetical protein ANANG_G00316740 [Anguilla anguilla]